MNDEEFHDMVLCELMRHGIMGERWKRPYGRLIIGLDVKGWFVYLFELYTFEDVDFNKLQESITKHKEKLACHHGIVDLSLENGTLYLTTAW